jgi:type IV secretion system protein VirB1
MIELLLACAPAVDPVTMSAIVKQESGGHPWSINDNNGRRSYRLKSKDEAVLKATELISAGHSIDMGLAQINSKNLRWLGLSVEEAFEPCTNISAGAQVLTRGFLQTGSLPAALSIYNTGKPDSPRGRQYARQVLRHAGVVVPAPEGGRLPNLPTLKADAVRPAPTAAGQKVAVSPAASGFLPAWR